jgi:TetR/AcrR family transcriptional regulator
VPRGAQHSRQAIVQAAAAEFAAHGFAGAGVDRIARLAGVNKAMIYYHFRNKAHLYHEIVREMFTAIGARTGAVASSPLTPQEKIDGFIEAFVAEAGGRPHLPPMMMREAAEGGRRLDPGILRIILGIFGNLRTILDEGARTRAFKRVDPVLMYFTLVGPIVMYLASVPVRHAIGHLKKPGVTGIDPAAFKGHLTAFGDVGALGDHLKAAARRTLERGAGRTARAGIRGHRTAGHRHTAGNSGEQA